MAFLFAKSKQKVGQDMVKSTKDLLAKLLSQDGQTPKVSVHRCKMNQEARKNRGITCERRSKRIWPRTSP